MVATATKSNSEWDAPKAKMPNYGEVLSKSVIQFIGGIIAILGVGIGLGIIWRIAELTRLFLGGA